MKNDEVTMAFIGAVKKNKLKIDNEAVTLALRKTTSVEETPQKTSRGPFRATLRGSLTISNEEKAVKAVNNFEKRLVKEINAKFDGSNKNIDEMAAKWFGEATVESLKKGVIVAFDNEIEVPILFNAMLANLAPFTTGSITWVGEDGRRFVDTLEDGKLTTKRVE